MFGEAPTKGIGTTMKLRKKERADQNNAFRRMVAPIVNCIPEYVGRGVFPVSVVDEIVESTIWHHHHGM